MIENKWVGRALFARALYIWWQNKQIAHENAGRFLDPTELREVLSPANKGLLLDGATLRLSDDDSFRNLALIATTGAGKTSSFILPNLLTLDGRSIVATDPSGGLYDRASGDLVRRGYRALLETAPDRPLSRAVRQDVTPWSRPASSHQVFSPTRPQTTCAWCGSARPSWRATCRRWRRWTN